MRIFLFAIINFICFCSRSPDYKPIDTNGKIKEIYLVSKSDSIITKISEIASDIEYIPLQSWPGKQIFFIDKIISHDNRIYINLVNDVLCFDLSGHFLYSLYGNNTVPERYRVAVFDFDVGTGDTTLVVLAGNEVFYFSFAGSGFEYVKTIKLDSPTALNLSFVPRTGKILLSSTRRNGFEPMLHVLINLNGDTLSYKQNYFKRFNPVANKIWDEIIHYQFDKKLCIRERFNDTVYSLDEQSDTFMPDFILNSRLSSTNSNNLNDPEYYRILPDVIRVFEVPRYLFYVYNMDRLHKVFYDKYEDKKLEIDPNIGVLKDDIGGGPDFEPVFCSDGCIYTWISVRDLKKYTASKDFIEARVLNPLKYEYLQKMGKDLKESDNPVIILIRPKT